MAKEPDPKYPHWYSRLLNTRGFGWLLAIGAVLAALAAIPDSVGKFKSTIYFVSDSLKELRLARERESLIAEADRLYFETEPITGAFDLYKQASDLGSPYAKATVAKLLDKGWAGTPPDRVEASRMGLEAYTELVNSNEPRDMYALAWLRKNAVGVPLDEARAIGLYENAAGRSFSPARHNLAWSYWNKSGATDDDKARAVNLWTEAADDGNLAAKLMIGKTHQYGWHGAKDPDKALDYLTRAYNAGSAEAARRLAFLYSSGDLGATDPDTVNDYFRKGHTRGDAESTYQLAFRTDGGVGMAADPKAAFALWEKAVAKGHIRSHYYLSEIYFGDKPIEGVEVDIDKAIELLEQGAQKEDEAETSSAWSMERLARRLQHGDGLPANIPRALDLSIKCADHGDTYCMNTAGRILWQGGFGVPVDLDAAMNWFERAMEKGNYNASQNIGGIAFSHPDFATSPEFVAKTESWLRSAANMAEEKGDEESQAVAHYRLGRLYQEDRPGFPADQKKASREFLAAAELSQTDAYNDIGWRYWKGIGLEQSSTNAVSWLMKALMSGKEMGYRNLIHLHDQGAAPEVSRQDLIDMRDAGLKSAETAATACELNSLAKRYEKGEAAPLDLEKANALYRTAAERGHVPAGINFARLNIGNRLTEPNTQKALMFLDAAIKDENVNAHLLKAEILYNGIRVKQAKAEAKSLLFKAQDLGAELDGDKLTAKGFPQGLFSDQMLPLTCSDNSTDSPTSTPDEDDSRNI